MKTYVTFPLALAPGIPDGFLFTDVLYFLEKLRQLPGFHVYAVEPVLKITDDLPVEVPRISDPVKTCDLMIWLSVCSTPRCVQEVEARAKARKPLLVGLTLGDHAQANRTISFLESIKFAHLDRPDLVRHFNFRKLDELVECVSSLSRSIESNRGKLSTF
ncbi:MAG: hypothetical protein WCP09_00185 [Candidatus Taylorbacteria bacterium]